MNPSSPSRRKRMLSSSSLMPPDFTPAEGVSMMDSTRYLSFAGRLLIGLPFAIGGLSKLAGYGPTTRMITATGLPFPPPAFAVAVAVEIGGGLLLIAGYQDPPGATGVALCFFVTAF